jgi:uncharacterized protein
LLYVLVIGAILALLFGPALWVRWAIWSNSANVPELPGTGGELAMHLLQRFDIGDVTVEACAPRGDHYDPVAKAVRLSPTVFAGKSLSAVAIAAHEVGHAIQHARGDASLALRSKLAPSVDRLAKISVLAIGIAPLAGLLFRHPVPFSFIAGLGLLGMIARVALHLVTLPIEVDASFNKALPILISGDYISAEQVPAVKQVLRSAAFTYVAAALADVLNLARWAAILLRR